MPVMPDCLNKTEAETIALLRSAGVDDTRIVRLWPAIATAWDDHTLLGTSSGSGNNSWAYAATVGADGTISYQQPGPGETFDDDAQLGFDIWGTVTPTPLDDDGLDIPLSGWEASPIFDTTPFDPDTQPWFRFEITTQHKPSGDAELVWTLEQFRDASVRIAKNDLRTAEVTISMFDPQLEDQPLTDFEHYLRVYYRDQPQPVFWGPLRTDEDYAAGTIKITAVDVLKVQHHYVRRGDDQALNVETGPDAHDIGIIKADWSGIQDVLSAAQNTDAQVARDVPNLGIIMGSSSTDLEIPFEIQRGQNVWDTITGIAGTAGGPDFEIAPVDNVSGIYAYLRCYDKQGVDRGLVANPDNGILWAYGSGPDNLTNCRARKLTPITHAHVLDDSRKHRETAADAESSAAIGVYVAWVQSNFNIADGDTTVLTQIAKAYIDAYGKPPHAVEIDPRPDAVQQRFYNEDFWVGDTVSVHAVRGFRQLTEDSMRIIGVELTQPGSRGPAATKLTLVPDIERTTDTEDS